MVPPQIWWFGYFGRRRPKSTRICPGQLWSRVAKVNQGLPWSALVQGNQSQPGFAMVSSGPGQPKPTRTCPGISWSEVWIWYPPRFGDLVTLVDVDQSQPGNSLLTLVTLDQSWPGQILVGFGYPGPELTMASPGWLWLPWTKSRVTKANQNYQGKDLVKNQSTGVESWLDCIH